MLRIPGARRAVVAVFGERYRTGKAAGVLAMDVVGCVCVTIGICLIVGTIFTYFHTVLPLLIAPEGPQWYGMLAIMTWLSFNLMYNYCMVLMTKPGRSHVGMMGADDVKAAYEHKKDPKLKGLWCKKCEAPRAPRAHHCPLCGYCVLKMDHHCPWVNQCVGHHNHKYFALMLIYIWASVTWAVVTISLHQMGVLRNPHMTRAATERARHGVTLCFVICVALCFIMSIFVWWTLGLVFENETTIERLTNAEGKTVNIYSFNNRLKNARVLFSASHSYLGMLLPSLTPPDSEGHTWHLPSAAENKYIANYYATGDFKLSGDGSRVADVACCERKDGGCHRR